MSKLVFSFLLFGCFVFSSSASAQTVPNLESLIKQLQDQIKLLNQQIADLHRLEKTEEEVQIVKTELKLTKTLKKGESSDEVKQLQEFLKQFPDIYPEGIVTGFFGSLTETAVKRFQEKHGIESIGIVGPKTLQRLNEFSVSGAPAIPAIPAIPAVSVVLPAIPAIPAIPASLSLPLQPASPSQPMVSPATPATPAIPATPAVPGVSSATPAVPAIPAQPSSSPSTPTPTPSVSISPSPTPTPTPTPTLTPTATPASPNQLFVSGSSSTYIGIYWADNSTNESEFIIERRFNGGSWSQIGSVAGNTTAKATTQLNTTYTDSNLIGAGTYDYRVKACNSLGCSSESNTTSRTINAAAPAAPSGLTVSVGSTSNIVSWTDNSNDEWGFRLKRRVQGGGGWFGLASVFNNSTGNSVSFTDSYQLIPNTIYEYVVRSYNTYESDDSNLVTVNFVGTASIDASPPSTPTGLAATVVSSSQINLSWNASTDNVGVTAYQVFRYGLFWYQTSGLTAQDTGLNPDTSYSYTVRALDAASYTSSFSTTVYATTQTLTSTPAPTSSVSFSPLNQASAMANILDALKSILQTLSNLLQ